MRVYFLLDRLFPRSYIRKFLAVAFIATHLPLLSLAVLFALNPNTSPQAFLLDALIMTLVGFGVMAWLVPCLLAPVEFALDLLERHLDGQAVPELKRTSQDRSGLLLTRIHQALKRLRSSKQRYTALFQAIPDGISCFNRQGEYTEVKLPSYFTYVQPDLVGKTPDDLYDPEMAAKIRERRQRMWETGDTQHYELERTVDGQISHREVSIFMLSQDEGAALVRDISERKYAEQRLQESETRFRSFFEANPQPCFIVDVKGNERGEFLQVNSAFVDFIGNVPDNLTTVPLEDISSYIASITHPEDAAYEQHYINEIHQGTRDHYRMNKRYVRSDGGIVWGDYSNTVARDENGDLRYIFATIQDISEMKRVQQRLQESETRFRSFFENSPNPCLMLESDGVEVVGRIHVNRAFEDFVGSIPNNLKTMKTAEILAYVESVSHPDDYVQDLKYLQEIIHGERNYYRMEKRYLHADGTWRWGDYSNSVIRDDAGNVVRLLATVQDITARKRAEQQVELAFKKLHASETKFRAFFEDSSVPCFIVTMPTETRQGQFLVNEAFQTFLDVPTFERNNTDFAEVLEFNAQTSHPEDLALEQPLLDALMRGERDSYTLEKRYFQPDGTLVWGALSNHALRDDDGNVTMLLGITQDISGQKRAQQKLQDTLMQLEASEAKFRAFFEGSGSAHSIINMQNPDTPKDDRLLTNRAFDTLMADTIFAELSKQTFADIAVLNEAFTHPEDLEREQQHSHALTTGETDGYRFEKRYFKRNGEVIWTTVTHSIIRQPNGNPNLLLSTVQDISDLKHTQNHLSRTLTQLEDAIVTKNMLMRETHHRVKNNLQVIASLLNLQSHLLSDEIAKEALSESRKRVMAMAEIHELMHQSDASNRIDFAHYLEELIELMRRSYSLDDIAIALELSPVTLPLDQAIPLALITNELVSNALKYAFPKKDYKDSTRPTITINLQQTDTTVTLCIDDNGVGLSEDNSEDSSLGMTIIKSLSGQLGGTLTFADKITHRQLPIAASTLHDTPPDESGLQVTLCFPVENLQEA